MLRRAKSRDEGLEVVVVAGLGPLVGLGKEEVGKRKRFGGEEIPI